MTQPEPLDLDAIEARARRVTSGPSILLGEVLDHARQDVPPLVAEVRRLRELLDERTATIADKALENAELRRRWATASLRRHQSA